MKPVLLSLCVLALPLLAGCSGNGSSATSATAAPAPAARAGALSTSQQSRVDKAAAIARAIESSPSSADAALQQHGMTEQQFEDLMYEIAADPEMSQAYAAKMRR
jgi:hypothetical protein